MKKSVIIYALGLLVVFLVGPRLFPTPYDCGGAFLCFDPWIIAKYLWAIGFALILLIVLIINKFKDKKEIPLD